MKNEMKSLPAQEEDLRLKLRRMADELYTFLWFPGFQSVMWRRRLDKNDGSQLDYDAASGEYDLPVDDEIEIGLFALKLDYFSMISIAGLLYSVMNNLTADREFVSYLPSVALLILSRYVASPAVSMLTDKYGEAATDQVAFSSDLYDMDLSAFSPTVQLKK